MPAHIEELLRDTFEILNIPSPTDPNYPNPTSSFYASFSSPIAALIELKYIQEDHFTNFFLRRLQTIVQRFNRNRKLAQMHASLMNLLPSIHSEPMDNLHLLRPLDSSNDPDHPEEIIAPHFAANLLSHAHALHAHSAAQIAALVYNTKTVLVPELFKALDEYVKEYDWVVTWVQLQEPGLTEFAFERYDVPRDADRDVKVEAVLFSERKWNLRNLLGKVARSADALFEDLEDESVMGLVFAPLTSEQAANIADSSELWSIYTTSELRCAGAADEREESSVERGRRGLPRRASSATDTSRSSSWSSSSNSVSSQDSHPSEAEEVENSLDDTAMNAPTVPQASVPVSAGPMQTLPTPSPSPSPPPGRSLTLPSSEAANSKQCTCLGHNLPCPMYEPPTMRPSLFGGVLPVEDRRRCRCFENESPPWSLFAPQNRIRGQDTLQWWTGRTTVSQSEATSLVNQTSRREIEATEESATSESVVEGIDDKDEDAAIVEDELMALDQDGSTTNLYSPQIDDMRSSNAISALEESMTLEDWDPVGVKKRLRDHLDELGSTERKRLRL